MYWITHKGWGDVRNWFSPFSCIRGSWMANIGLFLCLIIQQTIKILYWMQKPKIKLNILIFFRILGRLYSLILCGPLRVTLNIKSSPLPPLPPPTRFCTNTNFVQVYIFSPIYIRMLLSTSLQLKKTIDPLKLNDMMNRACWILMSPPGLFPISIMNTFHLRING